MGEIIADADVWRAELTIGAMHGYTGPEQVYPGDIIGLVTTFIAQCDSLDWFPIIVWSRGTVQGVGFPKETVIKVTTESNPLYTANATRDDVTYYAIKLAAFLAEQLQQTRIYLAVYPIRALIFER